MDIVAELLEPIWINRETTVVFDDLQARTGKLREDIIADAVNHYKDILYIADKFVEIGESYIEKVTVNSYDSGGRGTTD